MLSVVSPKPAVSLVTQPCACPQVLLLVAQLPCPSCLRVLRRNKMAGEVACARACSLLCCATLPATFGGAY